jgi:hypothetical protein
LRAFVAGSGADVVVLMEASPIAAHVDMLRAAYPYLAGCGDGSRCGGVVVLSRTPLADVSVQSMSGIWLNRLVTATTEIAGQRVNLVAAHLVKPYFDEFAAEELAKLGAVIGRLEGPVVLAGDFNAAAWSEAIERLMTRQGIAAGPGLSGDLAGSARPAGRADRQHLHPGAAGDRESRSAGGMRWDPITAGCLPKYGWRTEASGCQACRRLDTTWPGEIARACRGTTCVGGIRHDTLLRRLRQTGRLMRWWVFAFSGAFHARPSAAQAATLATRRGAKRS